MRRLLSAVAVLSLVSAAAIAQPAPPAPPKTTFELDANQLNLIGEAILNLPKKLADPLLADLNRQLAEQRTAAAKAAEAAKPADPAQK